MFDDLTLDDLRQWKRELLAFMRSHAGVQSFSLPDGVSMNVHQDNAWKVLGEINQSIKRKLGHGGRFIRVEIGP
jgi:hypothetical protein